MGYGTGKKDMPKIEGIAMAGKMHGGGVKLDRNNISNSEKQVLAGAFNSFGQAKVISGGHPKAGFMHKSKSSMPKVQGYNDREDESLGMEDGKESGKKQSMKDRRDEREGENKAQGNKPDGLTRYGSGHGKKKSPTKLKGGQVKLDKNNNGKIDGADFKMMKK
jgi:hypothetical protein|tara:strand:- start:38 stop:526 length:489 start_codon:yes stop_codon:yes gene_type:complete